MGQPTFQGSMLGSIPMNPYVTSNASSIIHYSQQQGLNLQQIAALSNMTNHSPCIHFLVTCYL
jgi:hypothetical protein